MSDPTPPADDRFHPRFYLSAGVGLFVVALLIAVAGSWLIVWAG